MDLISILNGNNDDKLSSALSATNKDQTPELNSTNQVQLHSVSGDIAKYSDAQDSASKLQSSDGLTSSIEGNSSKYKNISFSEFKKNGNFFASTKDDLKLSAKSIKYMIGDEVNALGDILNNAAKMGVSTFINETRNLTKNALNRGLNNFLGRSSSNQGRLSNGVAALIMDQTDEKYDRVYQYGKSKEGYTNKLWRDDDPSVGAQHFKEIKPMTVSESDSQADSIRRENDLNEIVDDSLKGDLKNYANNLKNNLWGSGGINKSGIIDAMNRGSIGGAVINQVMNRAQSAASKIFGSSFKLGTKKVSQSWTTGSLSSKYNFNKTTYDTFGEDYKSVTQYFSGYSDLEDFSARVDRFYDFRIEAPKDLIQLGLPPMTSIAGQYVKTNWNRFNEKMPSFETSSTPLYNNDNEREPRDSKPLDFQANINSVDTVRLVNGDTFDLGMFGAVALTKRLDMVASITTTFIEDNNLSVRKWMEDYKAYMYGVDGVSSESITPYTHRPIYQGFYYITFYLLDPSRSKILRSRTFYGVPNFDLNMSPSPLDVKMYQVNWDIIGEAEIIASGDKYKVFDSDQIYLPEYIKLPSTSAEGQ